MVEVGEKGGRMVEVVDRVGEIGELELLISVYNGSSMQIVSGVGVGGVIVAWCGCCVRDFE